MTERELERRAKHKLAVLKHVEEVSGSVSATCRYYGISRNLLLQVAQTLRRGGFRGSQGPLQRPAQLTDGDPGRGRGEDPLAAPAVPLRARQDRDVPAALPPGQDQPVRVWRILHKAGVNRLPASQRYKRRETRWKRYEKQRPGHQLQVDVKFIEPSARRAARSATTSTPRSTTAPGCAFCAPTRATTSRPPSRFIDHVLSKLPFQSTRFRPTTARSSDQSFHWHLLDKGIGHIRIRPRTPRLNGKVERSHRIDSEEFYRLLEGEVIDDARLFETRLQEWEDYYNYDRPHGALGGQTPYERLRQKAQDPLS